MMRLTVHLKKVKKERVEGKSIIRNTLSYEVDDDAEVQSIVSSLNRNNNVSKWYTCFLK